MCQLYQVALRQKYQHRSPFFLVQQGPGAAANMCRLPGAVPHGSVRVHRTSASHIRPVHDPCPSWYVRQVNNQDTAQLVVKSSSGLSFCPEKDRGAQCRTGTNPCSLMVCSTRKTGRWKLSIRLPASISIGHELAQWPVESASWYGHRTHTRLHSEMKCCFDELNKILTVNSRLLGCNVSVRLQERVPALCNLLAKHNSITVLQAGCSCHGSQIPIKMCTNEHCLCNASNNSLEGYWHLQKENVSMVDWESKATRTVMTKIEVSKIDFHKNTTKLKCMPP